LVLTSQPPIKTDVLIIGAGPVGLFQVFELGLLGLSAHLVDPLPRPGGQCTELYADKPIYDIPALPVCTGQELIERLLTQIKPFNAPFHGGQLVTQLEVLEADPDPKAPRFRVRTQSGLLFEVGAVVLACGVGAFLPRPLAAAGIEAWLQRGVFYGSIQDQIPLALPHRIWIVGGGEAAVSEALLSVDALSEALKNKLPSASEPPEVTLIHRRESLDAPVELIERFRQALSPTPSRDAPQVRLRFLQGQITSFLRPTEDDEMATGHPERALGQMPIQWVDALANTHTDPADLVSVNLGLSPQLGPLGEWGLEMRKKQIPVNTEDFSTSLPGVFAVGDVNTYSGKKKLILSGFHEATLAAYGIAKWVWGTDKIPFEYTTASPRLQARLGVGVKT
jgi:thioredoxin reductase (NADPH)